MTSRAFVVSSCLSRLVSSVPDVSPIPHSSLFAHSSFSFPPPLQTPSRSNTTFPTLPVCIVYPPSLCVSHPALCLSCLVLFCLLPLWTCSSQANMKSAHCIPRACPMSCFRGHRMRGDKQKGFSQLCVCSLGKGHQLLPPFPPAPLVSLVSSSPWTPLCPQNALESASQA